MGFDRTPRFLEQVGEYWNTRAQGYSMDVQEELEGVAGQEWLKLITEKAPKKDYKRVLDIGCGPGFFVTLLGGAGYEVTGIDYTENMLKEAKKNTENYGVAANLLRMDAQKLQFEDNSFDLIVTRNLTWNLEYPEAAYKEWLRVLRKGGILINADGNHYLHYTDADYRTYERKSMHRHMENIDVGVIDTIARFLPLSREHRPSWDISLLKSLGVSDIKAEKVQAENILSKEGQEVELIRNFVLVVRW